MYKDRTCKECHQLALIIRHQLCPKCYYKQYDQLPEVKERKRRWAKESGYSKRRYQERKEYYRFYFQIHSKTEKYKTMKYLYDKQRRDKIRFSENREKALQRDNYQCQICGKKESLHIHHIDGNGCGRQMPNNKLNNLITLCKNCHAKTPKPPPLKSPFTYEEVLEMKGRLEETTKKLRIELSYL
jgi:5-methylcytosine-specific restriction endonuclease McrA